MPKGAKVTQEASEKAKQNKLMDYQLRSETQKAYANCWNFDKLSSF